jgi:hypothetical protein
MANRPAGPLQTKRGRTAAGRAAVVGLLLGLALALYPDSGQGQTGWRIIVHRSNPVSDVSRDQMARLFLKKSLTWPDGRPAAPVDLPEDSAARVAFSRVVLGKSIAAVKAYWQQQIFSGKAVPPPEQASEEQVVGFVAANPLAVGYVSASAPLPGVKVVRLVD